MPTSTGTRLRRRVLPDNLAPCFWWSGELQFASLGTKNLKLYHFDDQICRIEMRQWVMNRKTGIDE